MHGSDKPSRWNAPPTESGGRDAAAAPSKSILRRAIGWAKGLALAAVVAGAAGFLLFASQIAMDQPILQRNADGMVVLTGGADRVADAIRLLRDGHARRLLITGVRPGTSAVEIARHAAESTRLMECCVDLGYAALNTASNAVETANWVQARGIHGSIIVVTSNYHMPRALVEMRRQLSGIELVPYVVVPERMRDHVWWDDFELFRIVASEYVKYGFARLRVLAASWRVQ